VSSGAKRRPAAIEIDAGGLACGVPFRESPNSDDRPPDALIDLLVIHAISLPPGEFGGTAIDDLFLNRLNCGAHPYFAGLKGLRVSAHFVVYRQGGLAQFVRCHRRAWHAGVSSWEGRPRCNDYSIGIELEGCDDIAFEDAQYETLAALTRGLRRNYPIASVVGHSDIAPARKTDPGALFDWPRYFALAA
jgi:AmpD protein